MVDWLEVARGIGAEFAATVAERHRSRQLPHAELRRLKDSGLTALLIPDERGGAGASFSTALQIVRELAAADGSVATLLGYHFIGIVHLRREPPARRASLEEQIARERLWLAGIANPRDDEITIAPVAGGFLLNGRKTFCTGAAFADRVTVAGRRTDDGAAAQAFIPSDRPGIAHHGDWDHLGLDRTESGSFTLTDVFVAPEELKTVGDTPEERHAVAVRTPVNHLVFANLYLGFAIGALRSARRYVHEDARPWGVSGVERAPEDPLIIQQFGEHWTSLQGALALADRAAPQVEALLAAEPDSTRQRGEAAIAVATAKVAASRVSVEITSRLYEAMGARATHNRWAFDRFWRDARTHTLHDPLAYKIRELGEYALNGRYPAVTGYS